MDPLTTLLACFALLAAGALAIGVLPWSDEELVATERAWATLLALPLLLVARRPFTGAPSAPGRVEREPLVADLPERKAA